MASLIRDGLELHYEVRGGPGPALLLPHLQFSWADTLDLKPFTDRFTVIIASPRGFAASERLAAYRVVDLVEDLVAVVQAVGFERFTVLGYSLTGAFAPWIARLSGRADAVVSAAFPIIGDYRALCKDVRCRLRAASLDPDTRDDLDARFDVRAALTFYRELAALPADALVTGLGCPLFAFWGAEDEEIARSGGVEKLAFGLDERGIQHVSFAGLNHRSMLAQLDDATPSVIAWLDRL